MRRRVLIVVATGAAVLAVVLALTDGSHRAPLHASRPGSTLPPWARQMLTRAPLFGSPGGRRGSAVVRPRGAAPYRTIHGYTCFIAPRAGALPSPCDRPARAHFIAVG